MISYKCLTDFLKEGAMSIRPNSLLASVLIEHYLKFDEVQEVYYLRKKNTKHQDFLIIVHERFVAIYDFKENIAYNFGSFAGAVHVRFLLLCCNIINHLKKEKNYGN